ncbi:MAG: DNA primase catalytic subunit PriS [Candidatus Kariarchaeaceae archaeon]
MCIPEEINGVGKTKSKTEVPLKVLQEDLLNYYREHFDINILWHVISKETFPTREMGFERLDSGFTRNKSFREPDHLKEYMTTFPIAGAYIGSLYKDRLLPADRYNEAITIHNSEWMGRELIFDLDLDEYDPVRQCDCTGRSVCEICWGLMQEAAEVMDETLQIDFGFQKRVWVYTGGRGYHCWILDQNTFTLDQDQRSAIIGYMQLIHDPKGLQKIDAIGNHTEILTKRIYQMLGRKFILEDSKQVLIEEAGFTENSLQKARVALKSSNLIRDIISAIPKNKEEIFLKSVIKRHYPRIDHKVTIDVRRLIRMPGSVHIRTKNICEYIDDPTTFNPDTDATSIYDLL